MTDTVQRIRATSFLPRVAVLELTYRCSHACSFCSCPWFAPEGGFPVLPELSTDRWKEVIDRLCAMGCSTFAFTGGEALLKEGALEIIDHAARARVERLDRQSGTLTVDRGGPALNLLSNGTSMSREALELCRRHDISLSMSLPGLATFGDHTGGADPERVLEWFRLAREREVRTTVGVTVTRLNLGELRDIIGTAFLAGAESLLLNRFMPGGRGLARAGELSLAADQLVEMLDLAEEMLAAAGRTGSLGTEIPRCLVEPGRYRHLTVSTRCSAARHFFVVGPSGHLRVCNHSPRRLAPMDRVEEVRLDPYWLRFARQDYLPAGCDRCRACHLCDGGCREAAHITGGTPDAPDPLFADSTAPRPFVRRPGSAPG